MDHSIDWPQIKILLYKFPILGGKNFISINKYIHPSDSCKKGVHKFESSETYLELFKQPTRMCIHSCYKRKLSLNSATMYLSVTRKANFRSGQKRSADAKAMLQSILIFLSIIADLLANPRYCQWLLKSSSNNQKPPTI